MESKQILLLKFQTLKKAVHGFGEAMDLDLFKYSTLETEVIKNGQLQRFEYCIELVWKTAKVLLFEMHGIERQSPKSAAKALYENKIIDFQQYELLFEMINSRNELAHIYKEELMNFIYPKLISYREVMDRLIIVFS